jgi:hypothetical protein
MLDNQNTHQDFVSKKQTFLVALFMGILTLFALTFFFNASPAAHAADNTYYAEPGGTEDCSAWDKACDLQEAIDQAANTSGKVLAASGVYTPGSSQNDTFTLEDGVTIEGGYLVNGTTATRDWETHKTVLSGDIDNNDTTDSSGLVTDTDNISGTNAYHVVTGSSLSPNTVLDGVYITAGSATGDTPGTAVGGGLKNEDGNPTIQNVVFVGNLAGVGGGMYNESGSPSLTNVTLKNNSVIELVAVSSIEAYGGGLYTKDNSDPTFNEVDFIGNYAEDSGGAMAIESQCEPTFTNVAFTNNKSERTAGATYIYEESHASFNNVTFSGNKSDNGSDQGQAGAVLVTHDSDVTFKDVDFIKNTSRRIGGAVWIKDDSNPTFEDVTFEENESLEDNGGAIALGEKPDFSHATFTNVDFIQNKAKNGGAISYISATAELENSRFLGNIATSNGGAVYSYGSDQTYVNVIFSGNEAGGRAGGIYNSYSNPELINVTIANNKSPNTGAGLYNRNTSRTDVENTILWGNLFKNSANEWRPSQIDNHTGGWADISHSIIQNSYVISDDGNYYWDKSIGGGASGNNIDEDPVFTDDDGADDTPGTADDNLTLTSCSPAVDEGKNGHFPGNINTATDLLGNSRLSNGTIDIGAYEHQGGNDRGKLEFSADTYSADEGNSGNPDQIIATVQRVNGTACDISALVNHTGGTATDGNDYTGSFPVTLDFTNNESEKTIVVPVQGDTTYEGDETIEIQLTSSNSNNLGTRTAATYTILDDDQPKVTLELLTGSAIAEKGGTATVKAKLSNDSEVATTITLAYNGTATTNTDYTTSTDTITINPGDTEGTVTLTAQDDTVYEGNETIEVEIQSVENGQEDGTQAVSLEITDDETEPEVKLGLADSPMDEDGGVATITATLSETTELTTRVTLSYSGTATMNTDYVTPTSTITIAAGTISGTVKLTAVSDDVYEGNETIKAEITDVENARKGSARNVTASINDDNDKPEITLELANSPMEEGSEDSAIVTATLSNKSELTTTIELAYSGTATPGTDYISSTDTITVVAGEIAGTAIITAVNDEFDEPDQETIEVTIESVKNGTEKDEQMVEAVINDDDTSLIKVLPQNLVVEEGGATASYSVTLETKPTADVTVKLESDGQVMLSGSTLNDNSLTFTADTWNTPQFINVTAVDDKIAEGEHKGEVQHTATSSDPVYNGTKAATVVATITDNDFLPGVTLELEGSPMAENGGTATVKALLTTVSPRDVQVNLGFSGTATRNSDYTIPNTTTITIPAGAKSGSATLTAIDDNIDEPDEETIKITIESVKNGIEKDEQMVTVVIMDDDTANITAQPQDINVAEGGATASYSVTLKSKPTADVTVKLEGNDQVTLSGDTLNDNTLTFTADTWNTPQFVNVAAVDDDVIEGEHTSQITHTVTSDDPDYTDSAALVVVATITDNEVAARFNITFECEEDTTTGVWNCTLTYEHKEGAPVTKARLIVTVPEAFEPAASGVTLSEEKWTYDEQSGGWTAMIGENGDGNLDVGYSGEETVNFEATNDVSADPDFNAQAYIEAKDINGKTIESDKVSATIESEPSDSSQQIFIPLINQTT